MERAVWSTEPPTRVLAGLSVGRRSGRVKFALARVRGEGWSARVVATDALTLPPTAYSGMTLARWLGEGIGELAHRTELHRSAVDVVGLLGLPDRWNTSFLAAALAELTGLTVVSGFEEFARLRGPRSAPLAPLADWFLFRSTQLTRLLVHVGPTLQLTLLPAGAGPDRALAFDVGPGCDFLDGLTLALSDGRLPFDPSGHFAVQGRHCDALIAHWSSHPYLLRPPPKTLDESEFGDEFRQASLAMARELRLSARDLLCSANHFLVRNLREATHRFLPSKTHLGEVVVSGGGSWNGLLWKLLRETLPQLPMLRTDELGVPTEIRRALHAALLAYGVMENLGGDALPRLLGHVTPGNDDNWSKWVCNLADCIDWKLSQAA